MHLQLRKYYFSCDGARYLAIECLNCPISTSLPVDGELATETKELLRKLAHLMKWSLS